MWLTEAVAVYPYLLETHTKIFMEEMKEYPGLLKKKKKIKGAGDREKNKTGQSRSVESVTGTWRLLLVCLLMHLCKSHKPTT